MSTQQEELERYYGYYAQPEYKPIVHGGTFWHCREEVTVVKLDKLGRKTRYTVTRPCGRKRRTQAGILRHFRKAHL
jgi:hypothetical protein